MKIGYACVSTKHQRLDLQVNALTSAGCQKIVTEVASGAGRSWTSPHRWSTRTSGTSTPQSFRPLRIRLIQSSQSPRPTRSSPALRLPHSSPELALEGTGYVFFTNGYADANENAVRLARLHTVRQKVLSSYRSFHGSTSLAVNLTSDPRRIPNDTPGEGVAASGSPLNTGTSHRTSSPSPRV